MTLALGLIATLMLLGIKMKLSPPNPNWRRHVPPPPTPPTRLQLVVFLGLRYVVWIAAIIAAAFKAGRLAIALMIVFIALIAVWVMVRARAVRRAGPGYYTGMGVTSLPPPVRRDLLRYLSGTPDERVRLMGDLRRRNPAVEDLLVGIEADDALRARVEIKLLRSFGWPW
jgi:hypothetical protein